MGRLFICLKRVVWRLPCEMRCFYGFFTIFVFYSNTLEKYPFERRRKQNSRKKNLLERGRKNSIFFLKKHFFRLKKKIFIKEKKIRKKIYNCRSHLLMRSTGSLLLEICLKTFFYPTNPSSSQTNNDKSIVDSIYSKKSTL